jgi:regulator of protease activity HflC (stomatin/prohibitin superfamily)
MIYRDMGGGSVNLIGPIVFLVVGGTSFFLGIALLAIELWPVAIPIMALGFLIAWLLSAAIQVIPEWEKALVLRLGRFTGLRGPGFFMIIPVFETVRRIDMRILTFDIPAQQVITKDNVPVMINGVLYFRVTDPGAAVMKVQDYIYAIGQYAQTALRDVIGGLTLDELLSEREQIGKMIEATVEKESQTWGLEVTSIKLQDIDMPEELKKMMSRQASAEREKRATITKAEGDKLAAINLAEAAHTMSASTGAMQLRTLQTIDGLGPTASNTVVIAIPIEIMEMVRALTEKKA